MYSFKLKINNNMENTLMTFDGEAVENYIKYELKITQRLRVSFKYVSDTLTKLGFYLDVTNLDKIDLDKQVKWNEGKSYNWCVIKCDNYLFIVRHYCTHFTVYVKETIVRELKNDNYDEKTYGVFTFECDTNKLKENEICDEAKEYEYPVDYYNCDNQFHDFNNMIKPIVQGFKDSYGRMLWNNSGIERPSHIEINDVLMGESIYTIDKLIFCIEELGQQHLELYAQNDMFDMIKQIANMKKPKGIEKVYSELKDGYYHGVGIKFENDSYMKDVYSLTRYYHDKILLYCDIEELNE